MADETFEERAIERLGTREDPRYTATLDTFVQYVDSLTDKIPVWREIAGLSEGLERNRIMQLRERGYLCLTATGLVILGRVGFEILSNPMEAARWQRYVDALGAIDWTRDNPLWQGNVIRDGKVQNQQGPVRAAVAAVKEAIGLRPVTVAAVEQPALV